MSCKLGYRDNGSKIIIREGQPVREHSMILDEQDWTQHRTKGITVQGLTGCYTFFGTTPQGPEPEW